MESGKSPSHTLRLCVLLWGLGAFFYFLLSEAPLQFLIILGRKLLVAGAGVVVVGGAAAFGSRIAGMLVPSASRSERLIFGAGLGLGVVSILVLILAHISTDLLLLVFAACVVMPLVFRREFTFRFRLPRDGFSRCILVVLAVFFVLNLSACFLPPLDYDVIEYHLGAPAEYVREGRMMFLPHNVYASFPANVEMLYLLALRVGGHPFTGAAVAKVINLCLITLSAAAVYLLGRKFASGRAGLIAAAALYIHPLVTSVAVRAYVEGGLVFYAVLALYAAVSFADSGSRGWAVVSGLSAGLAMGCKYTAFPFVAVPVVLCIAFAGVRRKDAVAVALAAFCCVAAFAPWAVRNLLNTGNPVYPLAYGVFGGSNWNPELNARFALAHSPPQGGSGPLLIREGAEFFRRMSDSFKDTPSGSALLLIFVPIAFLVKVNRRLLLLASGYFLLYFTVWFAATHRVDRFMVGALPALCVLAGAGADAATGQWKLLKWTTVAYLLLATAIMMLTYIAEEAPEVALGMKSERAWIAEKTEGATYSHEAVEYINDLPETCKVLLLGEAEIYYFSRKVVYSVVFNDNLIENIIAGQTHSVPSRLADNGVTHVFVNWRELGRLRRSYSYQYERRPRPGYLPHMSDREIIRLTHGLILESAWGKRIPGLGHREWELYAVGKPSGVP